MRDIGKASFYKNWYDIANSIEDKNERLSFYEMIFNYYFSENEPAENTSFLLKSLFIALRANIDADINRKKGGAPVGNKNANKEKQCKNNSLFQEKTTETNKVEVEEEVNVEEKVEVEVNDSTLLTTQNIIKNFAFTNGFTFGNKTVKELSESLKFESDAWDSLNKQLAFVKSKYPNKTGDELAKLFVASLHWDRKKETEPAPELPKEKEKNPPPKKCPICNSKLIRSGMDQVLCGHCREKGKLVWWEKENGIWTRQDSETA